MIEKKKLPISVLIVDDEPLIVEQLSLILGRRVEVFFTAYNGAEGYECFKNESPDLIISDIDMPVMNGIDFLKSVRADNAHIPFILSTGLKSLDILIEAIKQGITAFLPKPLQIHTLITKLEEVAHTKELEQEVKNSHTLLDQYKKIVDDSVIVSKADTKGVITYVNDMFCSISGYSREELIGKPHNIIRDPSMPSDIFKEVWKTIQAKKIWHGIIHNRAKDGSRYTVKSSISPILDSEGNIVEYIALREDISYIIEKDKLIENEQKKLSNILNHIESIVAMVSVEEELLFLNEKFFDIFPYENYEDYKKEHQCICNIFEKQEGYLQAKMGDLNWVEYMLQDSNQSHHVQIIDKEKKVRIFSITLKKIRDEDKDLFVVTMNDVTELQRAQEEAKQSAQTKGDFLANMSHEIRTPMNGILGFTDLLSRSNLNEQQKRYIDIINGSTHSLLGIINDILDFSKLESGKVELDFTEVNPIVEFDKIAQLFSAKMEEKYIVFDVQIDPQVSECIFIDLLRVQQVISNLLNNATKFTPQEGKVTFYTKFIQSDTEGIRIRIGVKDSGIGITSDQQKKIFEAFSQADSTTTRQFGGTGLGLTISSNLVCLMGSELKVESEIAKGSDFFFELSVKTCSADHPLSSIFTTQNISLICTEEHLICQEHVLTYLDKLHVSCKIHQCSEDVSSLNPEDIFIIFCNTDVKMMDWLIQKNVTTIMFCRDIAVTVSAPNIMVVHDLKHNTSALYNALLRTANEIEFKRSANSAEEKISFSGKVLVAEDNLVNQLLIEEYLQRYDLSVEIVENGQDALERLEQFVYDLVLMDINMPVMGGMEAVAIIKEKRILTPIIALTANAMSGDKERFLEHGFDDYLTKPIVLQQLEKLLETYLTPAPVKETVKEDDVLSAVESPSDNALNISFLMQELSLPITVIHKLLSAFLKSSDQNLLELKTAIDERDFKKIEHAAHKIKGSAGNMRFYSIEELAGKIEMLARDETNYDYAALYDRFEQLMKKTQHEITEILMIENKG